MTVRHIAATSTSDRQIFAISSDLSDTRSCVSGNEREAGNDKAGFRIFVDRQCDVPGYYWSDPISVWYS